MRSKVLDLLLSCLPLCCIDVSCTCSLKYNFLSTARRQLEQNDCKGNRGAELPGVPVTKYLDRSDRGQGEMNDDFQCHDYNNIPSKKLV